MECRGRKLAVLALVMLLLTICYGKTSIIEDRSPLDELPGYIQQVTHFGQRADFSHNGKHTLVECDKHNRKGTQYIDIYKLALDGSARTERVTLFSNYAGYKAIRHVDIEWP